jgi:hypothetical protein
VQDFPPTLGNENWTQRHHVAFVERGTAGHEKGKARRRPPDVKVVTPGIAVAQGLEEKHATVGTAPTHPHHLAVEFASQTAEETDERIVGMDPINPGFPGHEIDPDEPPLTTPPDERGPSPTPRFVDVVARTCHEKRAPEMNQPQAVEAQRASQGGRRRQKVDAVSVRTQTQEPVVTTKILKAEPGGHGDPGRAAPATDQDRRARATRTGNVRKPRPTAGVDEDLGPGERDVANGAQTPHRKVVTIKNGLGERPAPPEKDGAGTERGDDVDPGQGPVARSAEQGKGFVSVRAKTVVEKPEIYPRGGRGTTGDNEEKMGREPLQGENPHPLGQAYALLKAHASRGEQRPQVQDFDQAPAVTTARHDKGERVRPWGKDSLTEERTPEERPKTRRRRDGDGVGWGGKRGRDRKRDEQEGSSGESCAKVASHHERRVVPIPEEIRAASSENARKTFSGTAQSAMLTHRLGVGIS